MYKNLKIHFIGIGGIGMSGIAEVLINLGYPVSGSDTRISPMTEHLQTLGAQISYQHVSDNVISADVAVYSSAVAKDNIEIQTALKLGIPVIRRAEMLAELMRLKKYGIAVAGTHGKTTTTSLLAHVLEQNDLDPTIVIGGKLNQLGTNAKLGKGDFMVVEADESDGSFLHLSPTLTVITNIDLDHMENFKDANHYISAFDEFVSKIPFYGLCVLCAEDPKTLALAKRIDKRMQTYGFARKWDWSAEDIQQSNFKTTFKLFRAGTYVDEFAIQLMGKHNVLNALAVIAIASELGVSLPQIQKSLLEFRGVGRRLECLYQDEHILLFDDYGHHPTEIRATLEALRRAFPNRYLKVLFQPHRFTRLKYLFDDFVQCFKDADAVFLAPLYTAGEEPIRGISSQTLFDAMQGVHPRTSLLLPSDDIAQMMVSQLVDGDMILTLGAGDVTQIAKKMRKLLETQTSRVKAPGLSDSPNSAIGASDNQVVLESKPKNVGTQNG